MVDSRFSDIVLHRWGKRKRKKRRKRRLPHGVLVRRCGQGFRSRSSLSVARACSASHSSSGRARRRQRQWHARYAGFPGDVPLRAVFPSVVVRPEMLGIMAVLDQKDSTTLVVNRGTCRVGFPGYDAPRVMCPSLVDRPRVRGIRAGSEGQLCRDTEAALVTDLCSGLCMTGFAGYDTVCASRLLKL